MWNQPMMNKIEELFETTEKPSTKWSGYFGVYERHLSKFIGKAPKILEIGVLGGGSIELWLKYFGEGTKVIGVDIDPRCLQYKYDGDAQVIMGDQGSVDFWQNFLTDNTGFDIIIDDGSHIMAHQITTLQQTFPHLREGGIYICEDTHTSYWKNWGGQYGGEGTFLAYSKAITDIVNQQHLVDQPIKNDVLENYNNLYSVSFYNSMVVFEKKALKPFVIRDNSKITLKIG
jgi:SAM-dependent methyltransferase